MVPALELVAVTRTFGSRAAVKDLTLTLEPGAFLGLLGRNGAGKSTTIKLATGLLRPTSGRIRVLGNDPDGDGVAVRREMGVMPEDLGLLDRLTPAQFLRFVGRMHGLEEATVDRRRAELFDKLDLRAEPGQLLGELSFGNKKKASLAAALLHGPRLLFLDEPFEGIDPVTSRTVKDLLLAASARGVTIVLTSHVLDIVERLCRTVAILDEGELRGYGTLGELKARHAEESLEGLFVALMGGSREGSLSWL